MTCAGPKGFPPICVDVILEDHLIQQVLCNDLETVADRLPMLPTLPTIRRLCNRIQSITTSHFSRAERMLAELPMSQRPGEGEIAALRRMHLIDEAHAQDLIAALWKHTRSTDGRNVEQLGYMLRCLFDGCRRAIIFKESLIAKGGRATLNRD